MKKSNEMLFNYFSSMLVTKNTEPAMNADMGIVMIQAHTILLAIPQRTAENLFVEPTPIIDPDTT